MRHAADLLFVLQINDEEEGAVVATMRNGRSVRAKLAIGADGNRSNARKYVQVLIFFTSLALSCPTLFSVLCGIGVGSLPHSFDWHHRCDCCSWPH